MSSRRVTVQKVLRSRYGAMGRPVLWEDRKQGVEQILSQDGEEIELLSSGGQPTPEPGWVIFVASSAPGVPAQWTLYGIQPGIFK